MARKTSKKTTNPRGARPRVTFDTTKFENVLQVGGIQTAMLESPTGSGQLRRVALVNTGSPLRFTVALDRGGDIVDAFHGAHSLTYLTLNGITAPSRTCHTGMGWLAGWPAGLVTSCGPIYMGGPRTEDGYETGLHGHHSNTPAAVEMVINPDPHRGRHEMLITMTVRDTCMFEPAIEVRRTIVATLGVPEIRLFDEVTNRGNTRSAHHWLYHVNLGYPLLNAGAQFVFKGRARYIQAPAPRGKGPTEAELNRMKKAVGNLPAHAGSGERCLIVEQPGDRRGEAHVGLVNSALGLGIELSYPTEALPRLTNWQHFGPRGTYVSALEPFSGSLLGKANDDHPTAEQYLRPGQTRRYQLTIRVLDTPAALRALVRHDGAVTT